MSRLGAAQLFALVDRLPILLVPQRELDPRAFACEKLLCASDITGGVLWVTSHGPEAVVHAATSGARRIAIAFGWQVVAPGVVVLADMTAIRTNLIVVDEVGALVEPQEALVAAIVYQMPWQARVLEALEAKSAAQRPN